MDKNKQNPMIDQMLKLAEMADVLTKKQAKEFVTLLMDFAVKQKNDLAKSFTEDTNNLTKEVYKKIQDALFNISQKHADALLEVRQLTNKQKKAHEDAVTKIELLMEEVKSLVPKDGLDGYTPVKGLDYFDGKDGSPDTRQQIVDKINSGKDKDTKIEAKQITGLPEFTREVVREVGSTFQTETPLKAGANITITKDASGANVITGNVSGGSVGPGTINELAYFDTTTSIASLTTATYPSLTELSYVKGVTSAIQTQLNAKEVALTFSTGLTRSTNTITSDISTGISGGQTIIGSTSTNSGLTIKATSGVGTTGADIIFQTGNNGATEAGRIKNNGQWYIGSLGNAGTINLGRSATGDYQGTISQGSSQTTINANAGIMQLQISGSNKIYVSATDTTSYNNLIFGTDNTYDIGASGATRPRNIYIADTIRGASGLFTTQLGSGSTGYIFFSASTTFHNRSDGVLTLSNFAENDFGRLQLGGTTSSFPSIKRNSTGVDFRLADDSAYAPINASTVKANSANGFISSDGTAGASTTTGGLTFKDGLYTSGTASGSSFTWNEVTGTSQSASVNNGYITNNAGLVTVTLPGTAAVGDIVEVTGKGAGGWAIAQNASGIIHFGNTDTTTGVGGSLASTNRRDSVRLVCVVANNEWNVLSSIGNITIV